MSNDKVVRPDGHYLVRLQCGSLDIIKIENLNSGGMFVETLGKSGDYYNISSIDDDKDYSWVAEVPLDLGCIKLLQMNGGLQNAVELVKKDSTTSTKEQSRILYLEKELKRYKDRYGDMDSLSR